MSEAASLRTMHSALINKFINTGIQRYLWGQTSSKQRHSESPSFHTTRSLPRSLMALGLSASRSLASATGYHCLVQENEGWLAL